ncbi:hypothetical protein [Kitasatospora sp. MBT66]|uniref:hypothetical protein n=1 Tax=Kitasatospora sp. MBT66 TaxID=1444769 RepID=UPI000A5C4860|nr:hypothetical protein [Kitasatospora sp. MBT66]
MTDRPDPGRPLGTRTAYRLADAAGLFACATGSPGPFRPTSSRTAWTNSPATSSPT